MSVETGISSNGSNIVSSAGGLKVNNVELGPIGRGVKPLAVPPSDQPLTRAKLDAQQEQAASTFTRKEKALRYDFDVAQNRWISREIVVRLAVGPFDRGYQRLCFRMLEFADNTQQNATSSSSTSNNNENGEMVVAKFLDKGVLEPLVGPLVKEMYFNDVRCQAEAVKYCSLFNEQAPPQPIWFAPGYVVQFLERPGKPHSACEPMMEGHFVKHNNNNGAVLSQRQTPQAFSHFTYEMSGGKLVICDIQGVDNNFTDPQVHSESGQGYGLGNQGVEGIRKFLKSHTCNGVCLALGLPRLVNGVRSTDWTSEQKEAVRAAIQAGVAGNGNNNHPLQEQQQQQQEQAVVHQHHVMSAPSSASNSSVETAPLVPAENIVERTPSLSEGSNSSRIHHQHHQHQQQQQYQYQQQIQNKSQQQLAATAPPPPLPSSSTSSSSAAVEDKENMDLASWRAKLGFPITADAVVLLQRIDRLEQMAIDYMQAASKDMDFLHSHNEDSHNVVNNNNNNNNNIINSSSSSSSATSNKPSSDAASFTSNNNNVLAPSSTNNIPSSSSSSSIKKSPQKSQISSQNNNTNRGILSPKRQLTPTNTDPTKMTLC